MFRRFLSLLTIFAVAAGLTVTATGCNDNKSGSGPSIKGGGGVDPKAPGPVQRGGGGAAPSAKGND